MNDQHTRHLERRKYPRIDKRMTFELQIEDEAITAEMINLSINGAYCRVNKPLPLMASLKIVFVLVYGNDVDYVECEGVVVRVEEILPENKRYNIAIFFNDIEVSEKKKIESFIEKYQKNR
ncbi:PilZ domain-containing protein [Desulfococcaceae bacterium HSG8]|nr:PilZ domain-containing protein [Desulfococcaceae bacterium HSG8]